MAAAIRLNRFVLFSIRRKTSRWLSVKGAQGFGKEQPAQLAQRRQRRPEVVHGASQEGGAVLIVLLQPEVSLNQALQHLVAIRRSALPEVG
jgi:hypothetical protein